MSKLVESLMNTRYGRGLEIGGSSEYLKRRAEKARRLHESESPLTSSEKREKRFKLERENDLMEDEIERAKIRRRLREQM